MSETQQTKKYKVVYMAKDTYRKTEKEMTSKELVEFYQQKPYEQIISVKVVNS